MTIRTRMLLLLLPTLIAFVTLLSLFFYFNWANEISTSFRSHLKSIVYTTSELLDRDDVEWMLNHYKEKNYESSQVYQKSIDELKAILSHVPIHNIYVVKIEPVAIGEPVLLDSPVGPKNPIYDGKDPSFAYRQIYILDTADPSEQNRSSLLYDFSESGEWKIYQTKRPQVTPIYQGKSSENRLMTGYAPILDSQGKVVALVGADLSLDLMDARLKKAISIILLTAGLAIFFVIFTVYFNAERISKPIEKLKNSALAIAAGEYDEKIEIDRPKEIYELSNAFLTMRECLKETINRLQEGSMTRERMFGDYECALRLQEYMTKNVVETYSNPYLELQMINVISPGTPKGLLLRTQGDMIELFEALEEGFAGMYALISDPPRFPHLQLAMNPECTKLTCSLDEMPHPLIWSSREGKLQPLIRDTVPLEKGDFVFLYNSQFAKLFSEEKPIQEWFGKILRHFAAEGLESVCAMLSREISFITKNQDIDHSIQIICLRKKL